MTKLYAILLGMLCSLYSHGFNITFQVNMAEQSGFTTPAVAGNFNGWCGDCHYMTDANGDNIWEITIDIPNGGLEYKFTYDNWVGAENFSAGSPCTVTNFGFTNRYWLVSGDAVLDVACFNACSNCVPEVEPDWSLIWCDEFNGNSIDSNNWTHEQGNWGWGNNEWQNYTNSSSNSFVAGGVLNIRAIQESSNGSNYSSARLISNNKFEFQYGKVEARLKVPFGQGIWPAFWMLGENIGSVGWPQSGEIDIMEHINNEAIAHGTVHWNNGGHQYNGSSANITPNEFHVYGVIWNENYARFYIDDVPYFQFNFSSSNNSEIIFQRPFYLLLNLAVGGNWPGYPDGSTVFPATYEIDYVRVYESSLTPTLITTGNSQCSVDLASNDEKLGAINLPIGATGVCNSIGGNLSEASASSESLSACQTGEDLWYSFNAVTSGVRLFVNSTTTNILIELQDADGNLVDIENVQSSIGNEILNFGGLILGSTYYVVVRNFNSIQGEGEFSICGSSLLSTTCDYNYPSFSLCSTYKADYVGAQGYTFHFTSLTGGTTYTYTKFGSTKIPLYAVSGLEYETSYSVTIDALYSLLNGAGESELVAVTGIQSCVINIGEPAAAEIRSIDVCPNIKTMNSYIKETPHICGCGQFAWEVTRTDIPGLPQVFLGPPNSKNFQIQNSNGFYAGGTYSVRVSPVFGSEPPSMFGSSFCITVAGAAGMPLVGLDEVKENNGAVTVYPNPSNGQLTIDLEINSDALLIVTNALGEVVYQDEMESTVSLSNLESGIYVISIVFEKDVVVEKVIVE